MIALAFWCIVGVCALWEVVLLTFLAFLAQEWQSGTPDSETGGLYDWQMDSDVMLDLLVQVTDRDLGLLEELMGEPLDGMLLGAALFDERRRVQLMQERRAADDLGYPVHPNVIRFPEVSRAVSDRSR
jgi:hypothetical protein